MVQPIDHLEKRVSHIESFRGTRRAPCRAWYPAAAGFSRSRTHMAQIQQLACAALVSALLCSAATAAPQRGKPHQPQRKTAPAVETPPPLECGDYLGFQVLLDKQSFSPGQ